MSEAALQPGNQQTATEALNVILADVFALYVKTKTFHWHMSGPHFRDYHRLLDEQATEVFALIDPLAERIRKSGAETLRSIGDIARRQTIADSADVGLPALAMLTELRHDNIGLVTALKRAKGLVDRAGDNATSGLLDAWTDEAEGRVWFLAETTHID
jgi:starvation-inducible DNA-binding protein